MFRFSEGSQGSWGWDELGGYRKAKVGGPYGECGKITAFDIVFLPVWWLSVDFLIFFYL